MFAQCHRPFYWWVLSSDVIELYWMRRAFRVLHGFILLMYWNKVCIVPEFVKINVWTSACYGMLWASNFNQIVTMCMKNWLQSLLQVYPPYSNLTFDPWPSQAVTHGHWILLEDIDYAPMDVISVLLPLLESRSLCVPGHGNVIKAAPGFQLFATQRSVWYWVPLFVVKP